MTHTSADINYSKVIYIDIGSMTSLAVACYIGHMTVVKRLLTDATLCMTSTWSLAGVLDIYILLLLLFNSLILFDSYTDIYFKPWLWDYFSLVFGH
jgi:hypothetical protein